jgi:energy-coupling factor transporter transmembrane protein EcfT
MGRADRLMAVGLDGKAHFISWGPFQISLANLLVIALIVVLFVLAIVLPFPKQRRRP